MCAALYCRAGIVHVDWSYWIDSVTRIERDLLPLSVIAGGRRHVLSVCCACCARKESLVKRLTILFSLHWSVVFDIEFMGVLLGREKFS